MELVIAVAIGLNPYVATLFLAALAAFTGRLPEAGLLGSVPDGVWYATIVLFGLALPADLLFSKFARFAPYTRRASEFVAPAAAALFVAGVTRAEVPLPVGAAAGAVTAWLVSTAVTALAARASRCPAWASLGHVAVLMAATTTAACILPLGVAKPAAGMVPATATLLLLAWGALAGQTATPHAGPTHPTRPAGMRRHGARAATAQLAGR